MPTPPSVPDHGKFYSRAEVEEVVAEALRRQRAPGERRDFYIDEEFHAELMRAAVTAAQVAVRGVSSAGPIPGGLSKPEVEQLIDAKFRSGSIKLMGSLGLPITDETTERDTVLRIDRIMKLEEDRRKFVLAVITGTGSIVLAALSAAFAWFAAHAGLGSSK